MNVTVDRKGLAAALAIAERRRQHRTLPILGCVRLLADDAANLQVESTDLETCWRVTVAAVAAEPGSVLVNGKALGAMLRGTTAKQVTLSAGDSGPLSIGADTVTTTLATESQADYPVLPRVTGAAVLSISGADLQTMIAQVAPFASADDSRPVLTRVVLSTCADGAALQAFATDGYRLSITERPLLAPAAAPWTGQVDADALRRLARTAGIGAGHVDIAEAEVGTRRVVEFRVGQVRMLATLHDDTPPDFERIVPRASTADLVFDSAALRAAVGAALPAAAESAYVLRFTPADAGVKLSTGGSVAPFTAIVPAAVTGEACEFAVNARYLADYLASPVNGTTVVRTTAPDAPLVFAQPDDIAYRHLIMPMHIAR